MSSILKALRKLEEEKRGGKLEAPDLRVDQGRTDTTGRPLVPLMIGVVSGMVLVGLIFLWLTGPQKKLDLLSIDTRVPTAPVNSQAQRLPQTVVEQPVVSVPDATLPRTSAPDAGVAETRVLPDAAADEPARTTSESESSSTVSVSNSTESVSNSKAVIQAQETGRASAATTSQGSVIDVQQDLSPATAELPAGINLLVSEIFYQDDVNSMAVVNDLPVMIGSQVDSAVVTEIHADRVLFQIDGQLYTVKLLQP